MKSSSHHEEDQKAEKPEVEVPTYQPNLSQATRGVVKLKGSRPALRGDRER